MRRVEAGVAVALTLSMAVLQSACVLSGKPKTTAVAAPAPQPKPVDTKPAAPPEPLSVPQTQVHLPPAQRIDPDALAPPKTEEPPAPMPAARPPRRNASPPKPETPVPTPAAAAPPEASPAVQEVLTADERKRYRASADGRKAEIRHLLAQVTKSHRLNVEETREVKRIQTLVEQSDNVEKRGDMRQADALAERALVLARELVDGK